MKPCDDSCEQVFVYGTLRAGQPFRSYVDELVTETRNGSIRARMYHFATRGARGEWPFIVPGDHEVRGELLSFRDFCAAIEILDRVEDCPDLYVRKVVDVRLDDGASARGWVYFIRPGKEEWGRAIPSGDWVAEIGGPVSGAGYSASKGNDL